MRKIILFLFLCSVALGQNPYRMINSFNAGQLSELLVAREDLVKYQSGCARMENMLPIPQGGAQKRPGTVYVAESKENTAIRLLPFEFSVEQSYIIELGNQYARFYTDNAQILGGSGTEDISALSGKIKAHWLLNDSAANTAVLDDHGNTHDGTASTNTEDIDTEGQVGTGCFDLDGQYAIAITNHPAFSFIEATDGDLTLFAWIYVTEAGLDQTIISKWDETIGTQAREWKFIVTSDRYLRLCIADESLLLDSDLLAHWKLNDSAQTAAVDDATGNYDGALVDGDNNYTSDHSVAGKVSNAFDFDGGDDIVTVVDAAPLSFGDAADDSAFSISAWLKMDDATDFSIISKYDSVNEEEWVFYLDASDKLVARLHDNAPDNYIGRTYNTALTAQEGSWIHVVMTYDATEASSGINLYLNGSDVDNADSENAAYTAMHDTASDVTIGYAGSEKDDYANGKIDNIMLFNKELSAAEVTALYNSASGIEDLGSVYPYSTSDDKLATGWRFVAATYNGQNDGGAAAADDIIFYVDGAAVDITATNLATYSKMEETSAIARVGAQESAAGVIEKIWADKIDEVAVLSHVLSSSEVAALYDATGAYEITTPYLTADLFELKYEQSADVLYITHPDYETRKLSRLNNDDWPLEAIDIQTGPFRLQNKIATYKIAASATTGSVTLTATGGSPFISGTALGHLPSGSAATSKSQTGALFRLVHPVAQLEYNIQLEVDVDDGAHAEDASWASCGIVYKGATWTLVTGGTWYSRLKLQRNYNLSAVYATAGWEDVLEYSSGAIDGVAARNVSTSGTEDYDNALYRIINAEEISNADVDIYFSTDQTDHIGVVEITAVASPTSATATVLTTLASTDATHKWSEAAWSNYRGWPGTVTFFEDRLCFGGNTSQPDTIWGSVTSDYENMLEGADDNDAILFTLSSKEVNVIQWMIGKDKILIGTSGGEWTLAGSADEPLTPSPPKAEHHSSYGSANLQATLANESILFFQRGAEKMRELAYNWELDSYVAPDMTILVPEITGDGITNTGFQQTPNSILWCVKENGDIATFVYERKENITSWSTQITDGDFESVAVIHGASEDQVWVSVERTINSNTVRYIEYFAARDFGTDLDDAFYVDSGYTYDSTATTSITELDHLVAATVFVFGDSVIQASQVVDGSGDISITSASTVHAGLPYNIQMQTMPLSFPGAGMSILGKTKRISEIIAQWYNSGDFAIGKDASTTQTVSIDGMTTSLDRVTFPPGYDREGQVFIFQASPEPLTLLALMIEFSVP